MSVVGDSYELSWIIGILTSDLCFCLGASRGLDDRKGSNCGVDTCAKFLEWERLLGGSEGGEDLDPEFESISFAGFSLFEFSPKKIIYIFL